MDFQNFYNAQQSANNLNQKEEEAGEKLEEAQNAAINEATPPQHERKYNDADDYVANYFFKGDTCIFYRDNKKNQFISFKCGYVISRGRMMETITFSKIQ